MSDVALPPAAPKKRGPHLVRHQVGHKSCKTIAKGIEAVEEQLKLVNCKDCRKPLVHWKSFRLIECDFYRRHYPKELRYERAFIELKGKVYCAECRGGRHEYRIEEPADEQPEEEEELFEEDLEA